MKDYDDLWAYEWQIDSEIGGPSEYPRLCLVERLMRSHRPTSENIPDDEWGSGKLLEISRQRFYRATFTGLDVSREALDLAWNLLDSWPTLRVATLENQKYCPTRNTT